jgi:hypothetical protein
MPWLVLLLSLLAAPAQAQAGKAAPFDHLRTGFALTGTHNSARCESCHQGGVLKGTPRDCVSCPVSGQRLARGNVVMTANHLATTQSCDSCHGTKSFSRCALQPRGVTAGSCASCHNGGNAGGKPGQPRGLPDQRGHATAGCDSCHKGGFASWTGARVHASFTISTGCAGCHGGSVQGAAGKPATPIHSGVTSCEAATPRATGRQPRSTTPASAPPPLRRLPQRQRRHRQASHPHAGRATNCFSCHATNGWKPSKWTHSQLAVAGQCASCHTGGYPPADGRSANHVPYASRWRPRHRPTATPATARASRPGRRPRCTVRQHRCAMRQLPQRRLPAGGRQAGDGDPRQRDGQLRELPQVHQQLGRSQGRPQRLQRGDQLRAMPQRQRRDRQVGHTHPGGGEQLLQLPQRDRLDADEVEPHAGDGDCASARAATPAATRRPTGAVANHIPYATVPVAASANCDSCHKRAPAAGPPAASTPTSASAQAAASAATPAPSRRGRQAGNGDPRQRERQLRELPQVHQQLVVGQGRPQRLQRGDQLRAAATTAVLRPASRHAHPGGQRPTASAATASRRLDADEVEPHAGDGDCASAPAATPAATRRPTVAAPTTSRMHRWRPRHRPTATPATARASRPGRRPSFHSRGDRCAVCASCHSGAFPPAVGKPTTAIHANVTGNCESCHKSTSNWSSAKVDHSGFNAATNCAQLPQRQCGDRQVDRTHVPVGRPTASAATPPRAGRRRSGTTRR